MWIPRAVFDAQTAERIKALEEARLLSQQNANLQNTLEWFQVRVHQLEKERAHLLFQYMGVKVEVPQFVKPEPSQDDVLGAANVFQDVGDEEAKRLKIQWDELGVVK